MKMTIPTTVPSERVARIIIGGILPAFCVCLAVLAAAPSFAAAARRAPPPPAPAQGAADFYRVYLRSHPLGVPNARIRQQLTPFLSSRLLGLIQEADRAETRYAEATRRENPPLIEGNIFTSLFEGATTYKVAMCEEQGDGMAMCEVELAYRVADEGETRWTDTVVLVREDRRFRVDDVIYGGSWAFSNKGRLTDILNSAIAEGQMPN
jgi:hypothetical protein